MSQASANASAAVLALLATVGPQQPPQAGHCRPYSRACPSGRFDVPRRTTPWVRRRPRVCAARRRARPALLAGREPQSKVHTEACGNTKGYSSTDLAMGFANGRAGTQ